MKKSICRKIIGALCLVLMMTGFTGCLKSNYNMTIRKDRSMELEYTLMLSQSVLDMMGDPDAESVFEDWEEGENENVTVEDAAEEDYKGKRMILKVKDIDEVSTYEPVVLNLGDLDTFMQTQEPVYFFRVEHHLFKDHFYADFIYNFEDEAEESMDESGISTNSEEMEQLLRENVELGFSLVIESQSVSTNGTLISEEKGVSNYKWNIDPTTDNNITFEFELKNQKNILTFWVSVFGFLLFILGLILVIIAKSPGMRICGSIIMITVLVCAITLIIIFVYTM